METEGNSHKNWGSTKERSVNFSSEEVKRLKSLVEKNMHILMSKKTDSISARQREQAWCNITKEFNAIGDTSRTIKQLKYKFENMKRTAKKEATKERQEIIRTGGGRPLLLPPASEDATDWLRSIMSGTIDGNQALYDDDVINLNSRSVPTNNVAFIVEEIASLQKNPNQDNDVIVLPESEDCEMLNFPKSPEVALPKTDKKIDAFDSSTPHSSLRKPVAPPLRRQMKKKQGDNVIKQALREQKLCVLKDVRDLEMEKIQINIKNQKELHEQTLQHNEEKHKLEILKLELEIDILKFKRERENK